MQKILFVAAGGSVGAVSRFLVSVWFSQHGGTIFPWGTLCVNAAGSFAMGIIFELGQIAVLPPAFRTVFAVGFLGAFTTFSTFSLETLNLFRDGEPRLAFLNIGLNLFLGLSAVVLGFYCARLLLGGVK